MRSLSKQSRPVHRIVFGTATLLAIGSLLTLAASQQSSRAVASPSNVGVSYGTNREATDAQGDPANEVIQETTTADSAGDGALSPGGGPGIRCCITSAGSCVLVAGSACPSGSSGTTCPCNPDPV